MINKKETLFEKIFRQSLDMMCIADLNGYFLKLNRVWSKTTGWSVKELMSKPYIDFVHPDDREPTIEAASNLTENKKVVSFENRYICKDGCYIWLQWNAYPDKKENLIYAIARDITDYKDARHKLELWDKLRDSEARYRQLFDSNPMPMWLYDTKSLKFVNVNEAAIGHYGYTKEEFLNMTIEDIRPKEEHERLHKYLDKNKTKLEYSGLWSHKTKSGKIIEVEITSHSLLRDGKNHRIVLAKDITEKNKLRKEIVEAEEKYRTVFENAIDGIMIGDTAGKLHDGNTAMVKMLGFRNKKEMLEDINKTGYEFYVHPGDKDKIRTQLLKFGKIHNYEAELYKKDRTKIWVSARLNSMKIIDHHTLFVGIVEDITERKKNVEIIQTSLKEKDTMLKEIHHRVKNNLQIISSLLKLQSSGIKDEHVREIFLSSLTRIKSMAIIHQKLYQSKDFTKIPFGMYINQLVKELCNTYSIKLGRVNIKVNAENIFLNIDTSVPFGLILNELISNSLKHAFPGDISGKIELDLKNEDGNFTLVYRDNGIGMRDVVENEESESLGLQLIQTLTNQLDGKLTRTTNKGTEYRITFKELGYKERM